MQTQPMVEDKNNIYGSIIIIIRFILKKKLLKAALKNSEDEKEGPASGS